MSADHLEMSVSQARDRFSDAVNRAAFGGEITWVTRGSGKSLAAAIVPASLVHRYEQLLEQEDAREAQERLDDIHRGKTMPIPASEVATAIGL